MIDVHCHLNFQKFENDFDEVIKQAQEDGVEVIINTGTSIESSRRAVELAEQYTSLYAIIGIHPHHADKVEKGWDKELEKIAKSSKKVVAIGEIGLDYYSYASNGVADPKLQKDLFIRQLEMAHDLGLPLQIHNRQAGADIVEILDANKNLLQETPGMFHCMSGNLDFLDKVLEMGFCIGFDGNITYDGIAKGETSPLPELVKQAPIDRILTETDSPYLTPNPYRGSRNVPSHVIIVGEFIAKIKGLPAEKVESQTTQNAKRIFKLEKL